MGNLLILLIIVCMQKITTIFVILLILASYFIFINFDRAGSQNKDEITIGLIAGLSGPFASTGENVLKGAQLAVEDWNTDPNNRKVRLIVEDDAFDPKKGLSAYQKLKSVNTIDGLFNMTSPTMNVLYPTIVNESLVIIQFGEQDINPSADNVFNIGSSVPVQKSAGEYLQQTRPNDSVIVVMNNDSTLNRFVQGFESGYGSEIKKFKMSYSEADFKSTAAQIISENPDTIVIAMIPDSAIPLINALAIYDKRPNIIFSFFSLEDYEKLGENISYIEGAEIVSFKDGTTSSFKDSFVDRFGQKPGVYADYAYDGMRALISSYDKDENKWKKNITKLHYDGVSGIVEFDSTGTRKTEIQMQKIDAGKLVNIDY